MTGTWKTRPSPSLNLPGWRTISRELCSLSKKCTEYFHFPVRGHVPTRICFILVMCFDMSTLHLCLRMPCLCHFSFLRQTVDGMPYIQKHLEVQKWWWYVVNDGLWMGCWVGVRTAHKCHIYLRIVLVLPLKQPYCLWKSFSASLKPAQFCPWKIVPMLALKCPLLPWIWSWCFC